VVLEPDNVAILGLIVFVVCLLSSGLGVRAALRVDPATALGGRYERTRTEQTAGAA
jgi:putative ABC transport system permease protein